MAFDSISNSTSIARDFAKKKKASRSAKLKQCKLDARRQQWLSQVKSKDSKGALNVVGGEIRECASHGRNERDRVIKLLEVNPGNDENYGSVNQYSDSDSSSHSPTSHSSSVVGSNCSGTSFTGSGSSSRSSNSSSSGRSHSGDISEEEDDDDDGCLSDWEAVADALAASDTKQQQEQLKPSQESPLEHEKPDLDCPFESGNSQHSFPTRLDRNGGPGGVAWACPNGISAPSSCPICCEDLDLTDTSFLPCSCGFRLCLFCHKRILEEDGRCPGCRKQYQHDGFRGEENGDFVQVSSSFRLIRSYSVITRGVMQI
ncbi:General negative regulator of transcription subunit 4 [Heracleum sosnowskyi]|uniref:General negative regulator of transcription subunit 4 n=1 Tax=Heracleum sosnowskyi TaxID=360622 RepID=A0AAD8H167_9APIA|nr:General negative regulator of transcription subunit 4 [Heracleum sosnowskyi]